MDCKQFECVCCKNVFVEPRLLSCLHCCCTNCLVKRGVLEKSYSREGSEKSFRHTSSTFSSVDSDLPFEESKFRDDKVVVTCPVCFAETVLPNGDIDKLPIHYGLQSKISSFASQMSVCVLCTAVLGSKICEQCNFLMCKSCAESHVEFSDDGENQHTLKPKSRVSVERVHKEPSCLQHPNQLFSRYCIDCHELICQLCISIHGGHRTEHINSLSKQTTVQVQLEIDKNKHCLKDMMHTLESLNSLSTKVWDHCGNIEKQIKQYIASYKQALCEHEEALLNELVQLKQDKMALLTSQQNTIKEKYQHAEHAVKFGEDLLQNSSDVEFINVAQTVIDRLKTTGEHKDFAIVRGLDSIKFLPEEKSNIINSHQMYGVITAQMVSPDHCFIQSDLTACRQNSKNSLIVITQDCDEQPLNYGGEKVVAKLKYKDVSQRRIPVTVTDRGDGSYVVSFIPDIAGALKLSISIQNKDIRGSPFHIFVPPLRPHRGVYHCCTFCSSSGNKKAVCGCGSKMPGGYNGCGHGHVGHPGGRHWSCCGNLLQNSECGRAFTHQISF